MPESKNRRKNGKRVNNSREKRTRRIEKASESHQSGVTLQDLINVLAYQEYEKRGELPSQQTVPSEHTTISKDDLKPCKGQNVNVCVAEGCYNESCLDRETHIQEER